MAKGAKPITDTVMKDLYGALGVERDATTDEIKDAYWRHVRFHSAEGDPQSPGSQTRMAEIREAYEVLSDPTRRAQYDAGDRTGAAAAAGVSTQTPAARQQRRVRNPLDRLTAGMPRAWRIAIDWVVTIAGAIPSTR